MISQQMTRRMMETIEFEYYDWLCGQINIPRRNRNSYNDLFMIMHNFEFVWIVDKDDNRVGDAQDLRVEFLNGREYQFTHGVSVLEILVALSRRMAFNAGGEAIDWAWKLINNLKLNKSSDPLEGRKAKRVGDILEALIWRTYETDGKGGFFPLVNAQQDQTKMEIWDQMQLYSTEILRGQRTD